jgi:hypothetical protein
MKNKIKRVQKFALAMFLGLALCGSGAKGQTAQLKSNADNSPTEIKLEHDALGKAPTINVQVGNKTYPFLFDTGGGITTISPSIAKEIGCEPFGQITGFNAGGTRLDFKRCDNVDFRLGNFSTCVNTGVFEIFALFLLNFYY